MFNGICTCAWVGAMIDSVMVNAVAISCGTSVSLTTLLVTLRAYAWAKLQYHWTLVWSSDTSPAAEVTNSWRVAIVALGSTRGPDPLTVRVQQVRMMLGMRTRQPAGGR